MSFQNVCPTRKWIQFVKRPQSTEEQEASDGKIYMFLKTKNLKEDQIVAERPSLCYISIFHYCISYIKLLPFIP